MSYQSPAADASPARTVRTIALAIGVVYTLVGVLGFFVTGFSGFASDTDKTLLGFEVNPLHNLVHLAIGVAGILMSRTLATARTYGWLLAIGYGAAFVYGLFSADNESINFLSINWADNWLHLVSVLGGLVVALLPVHGRVGTPGTRRTR
jgi:hypothetical protein